MNKRKKLVSIILSLTCPGMGQIYNGHALRGILFFLSLNVVMLFFRFFLLWNNALLITYFVLCTIVYFLILVDSVKLSKKNKKYTLKKYNRWFYYVLMFLFSIILFFGVRSLIYSKARYQRYKIESRTMEPAIDRGDLVVGDKKYYKENDLKIGDIVTFKMPGEKIHVVKRCVGLGGDKIEIINFELFINDKHYNKIEIILENPNYPDLDDFTNLDSLIIEDNHFFALGDNRANSLDSRYYGTISYDAIESKILYKFLSEWKSF